MKPIAYLIGLLTLAWFALLAFAESARVALPGLLEPLFRATGGAPDVLAALWGSGVILVLLALLRTRHRRS